MQKILEKIKEFDTIIIHGHIRPDGDCIGSQYGLKYLIEDNFPEKKVYVTGEASEYMSFVGKPEMIDENLFKDSLSICVDCPKLDRLSDNRINLSKYTIKIDHHTNIEQFTHYEYTDSESSSCTSIITELYLEFKNELILSKAAATALYVGLLTDTGRFQNLNVTSKTFMIASVLVSNGVNIAEVNNILNLEDENVLRFKGYCLNNFKITENGFAYLIITKKDLEKFNVDEEKASSFVTILSTMKECPVWALLIESNDYIRIRLRSRDFFINELAEKYNGGGHKYASGGRIYNMNELKEFIKDSDDLIKKNKEILN